MKFFKSLLFLASVTVASARQQRIHDLDRSFHDEDSRDAHLGLGQIKEHHERRMAKLEELIEQRRQKIEDHHEGRRKLSDEDYNLASKQHKTYSLKLKQMQESNTDEAHMERMGEIRDLHQRSMRIKLGEDGGL
eukprot:scaffold4009_cov124-Cylindrotheca_fusiformis.AAC.22